MPIPFRFLPLRAHLLALVVFVQSAPAEPPNLTTFSIVARDPKTGELGIAVQSKVPAVGSIVPWAQAEIGAVATQSAANVQFGPLALVLMREQIPSEQSLETLLREDPLRERRQLAIVPASGPPDAFTGSDCLDHAGHRLGTDYAVQGNLLTGPEVLDAMAAAFETTTGELAHRLVAALRAGQAAGGDRRGKQSAALLVVRSGWGYGGLNDRYRDLRVDDDEEPIEELARILAIHEAVFPRPEEP